MRAIDGCFSLYPTTRLNQITRSHTRRIEPICIGLPATVAGVAGYRKKMTFYSPDVVREDMLQFI